LEILLKAARDEYQSLADEQNSLLDGVSPNHKEGNWLTFEESCSLANLFPLSTLADEYVEFNSEERENVAQGKFAEHHADLSRLPTLYSHSSYWSESSCFSAKICILDPESMLQVFFLNPENIDAEVVWEFGPIFGSGWVGRNMFHAGVGRLKTILVATESASDAKIIRRALKAIG